MAKLKKYDLDGKALGEVAVEGAFLELEGCEQLVKDILVALQRNKRQWSANTKGRSEVAHSNQKPHRQKGTGKARQGSLAAPQYKGGGIVFGPKPKFEQHIRINKKERRKAVSFLLGQRMKEGQLYLLDDSAFASDLSEPKTARVATFLKKLGLTKKRVLFVAPESQDSSEKKHQNFFKSVQNISCAESMLAPNINVYELAKASSIVVGESALEQLKQLLTKAEAGVK